MLAWIAFLTICAACDIGEFVPPYSIHKLQLRSGIPVRGHPATMQLLCLFKGATIACPDEVECVPHLDTHWDCSTPLPSFLQLRTLTVGFMTRDEDGNVLPESAFAVCEVTQSSLNAVGVFLLDVDMLLPMVVLFSGVILLAIFTMFWQHMGVVIQ